MGTRRPSGMYAMRLVAVCLLCFVPTVVCSADDPDDAPLRAAGLATDGPALLDFVRQRSRAAADADELKGLVRSLGSTDAATRDRAAAALVVRGPLAVPVLRQAVNDLADPAVAARAKKCLAHVEGRGGSDTAAAVLRQLAVKNPDGAVEAVLAYLPFADDEAVLETATATLVRLAFPGDKAHPALRAAIESPVPLLRATAAETLTRPERPETRPAIHQLLADPALPVRRRAALALASVEDVAAVPVLIDLIGELTRVERTAVEDTLRGLAGETGPKDVPTGEAAADRTAARVAWAAWWKKIDGTALIAEFRSRTLAPADEPIIAGLIKKLGDGNYRTREKATAELVEKGAKVLPALRDALTDPDSERVKRAEDCVARINQSDRKRVPAGSARLVALRRAEGAAAALIAYLPFADDDDSMATEVRAALTALARDPNGRSEPALLAALTDSARIRRSAAAEALCRGAGADARPAVRKLLADPDPTVRQSTAAALAMVGEKEAVQVLIDGLAVLPAAQSWATQDLLYQLAGDKAPAAASGDTPEERKKYRDAWAAWWTANGSTVDLARLSRADGYLGYTLLIEVSNNNSVGRVIEVGRDGKIRWEIKDLRYPVDAVVLTGDRVLITEWDGNRVAEFDFRGKVLWKKEGLNGKATNAQRLPNGNTFICTTSELLEVDRAGRTVFQIAVPLGLTAGYRAANGDIVCLRNDGQVARYDTAGKVLKTFASNRDTSWTSGLDLARNGNILVTQPSPNSKVTEYDPSGTVVKEWSSPGVTTATRLTNGNILAASHGNQTAIEYDRTGKKVWEYKDEFHIFRAKRR